MLIFETDRLIVRQLNDGDFDAFYAICANPDVVRYMGDGNPLTRELTQKWIDVSRKNYEKHGYGCSAVIEKATGDLIGFCGLIYPPEGDQVEIIYAFTPSRWGQGYASEVARAMLDYGFRQHELARIDATIDPSNTASVHVVEKLGLIYDHTDEDENGLPTARYGINREAWLQRESSQL